ncbi:MAG: creatininase family protein [Candidatus Zixiibacteriota bacterium]|nr:MAG: creatininase family protein [candidate division Zixibacteria bacterium]
MERLLFRLSWPTVRELVPGAIDTVLLPVGTIEAHGSACLGTDVVIPEMIAEGIADRVNALIAPSINYGVTKSLYRYSGTGAVRASTLEAYFHDVLESMANTGFRNVVVMNGHGGNNSALKKVAYEFHRERKTKIAVIHWWELCGDLTREFFGHVGGHGGTDETALVEAIDPNLAGADSYDADHAFWYRPGADVYPVPGTILLYKENEGYPEFDVKKAGEYRGKVVDAVGQFVELVIDRWRKYDT